MEDFIVVDKNLVITAKGWNGSNVESDSLCSYLVICAPSVLPSTMTKEPFQNLNLRTRSFVLSCSRALTMGLFTRCARLLMNTWTWVLFTRHRHYPQPRPRRKRGPKKLQRPRYELDETRRGFEPLTSVLLLLILFLPPFPYPTT